MIFTKKGLLAVLTFIGHKYPDSIARQDIISDRNIDSANLVSVLNFCLEMGFITADTDKLKSWHVNFKNITITKDGIKLLLGI